MRLSRGQRVERAAHDARPCLLGDARVGIVGSGVGELRAEAQVGSALVALEREWGAEHRQGVIQCADGQVHPAGQLRPRGTSTEDLGECVRLATHLMQRRHLAERHACEARLLRDRLEDRLADPPDGVRDELAAFHLVEPRGRAQQAEVALGHEVHERHVVVPVALRHRHDEAEVRAHQRVERLGLSGPRTCGERALLVAREQRVLADALEVGGERIARDHAVGRHESAPSITTSSSKCAGMKILS